MCFISRGFLLFPFLPLLEAVSPLYTSLSEVLLLADLAEVLPQPELLHLDLGDRMENPYLNVVNKKLRSIKKKFERIVTLEAQVREGKVLNEEQVLTMQ